MPLLRLRSDEQLVALFRCGNNDAFRVIHDRYRQRLFAYTRQMLSGSRQDAEDALQDVFVRAYGSLRASDRELALRAWLYRIAHNRCIDELRRPVRLAPELAELARPRLIDPIEAAEQRESLRRLVADVRRLPEQQRSALLMRELGGMSYAEMSAALGVSVAAVKSLLVRARVGLAQAVEARDTACTAIRDDLVVAHDRGVRLSGNARRHLHDCPACREFRGTLRGTSKQFAALLPGLGPLGVAAKVLGLGSGGGAAAGSGAAGSGGAVAAGGVLGGGGVASLGAVLAGTGHVATLLAAAAVTAGGAVELQKTIAPHHSRPAHHAAAQLRGVATPSANLAPAPVVTEPVLAAPPPSAPTVIHRSVAIHHGTRAAAAPLPAKPVVPFSNPTVTPAKDPGAVATTGITQPAGTSSSGGSTTGTQSSGSSSTSTSTSTGSGPATSAAGPTSSGGSPATGTSSSGGTSTSPAGGGSGTTTTPASSAQSPSSSAADAMPVGH